MCNICFQTVLVHTPETICLTYFMDLLLQRGKPVMLVGNAGVGKTILVSDKVTKLKEDYIVAKVPFNYYTTSAMLQRKNRYKTKYIVKWNLDYLLKTLNCNKYDEHTRITVPYRSIHTPWACIQFVMLQLHILI